MLHRIRRVEFDEPDHLCHVFCLVGCHEPNKTGSGPPDLAPAHAPTRVGGVCGVVVGGAVFTGAV